jgi:hypothetical protein
MRELEAAEERAADVSAEAQGSERKKLLPMRLTPFAPPDPASERKTAERLRLMSFSQLRNRRAKIDKRLYEMGLSVGEPALAIPSVRGTGLVDIDRIARKIDDLERAGEHAKMEKEASGNRWAIDLSWFTEAFRAREIRARRNLLVSELGLALCAADLKTLAEWAPHIRQLLELHVSTARRIDEMFVEMRIVDEEFERRAHEGLTGDPPKEIDHLIAKALDQVDDVGTKAVGTISDLTKSAAKTAAKNAVQGGGQAVWGIVRESAKGAFELGTRTIGKLKDGDEAEPTGVNADLDRVPPPPTVEVFDVTPRRPQPGTRIPDLLRQLARLRDDGILSEDEFAAKKQDLLGRL